ncbi:SpoIIE family protein phosphatase [Desulfococcaceae bacterium HSG8]|nr:SpoIIE family protein phosphatase [Desulfococcaceae bacterium HSG8]
MNHEPNISESCLTSPDVKIRVLLIDDQAFIGKIIGRMLESEEDIDFHYFKSARDGLRMADEISPTVILQDLVMPEINGLHMVYYFRAKDTTQHTPLIVLSADENPEIKAEAFNMGANDYMVKPPDKIELVARIRYHSQAYINMIQRDEAYRRVEEQTAKLTRINQQLTEQIVERERTEEALRKSKKKVEEERELAQTANIKVMDSIRYAKMIQHSLLPNPENIKSFLPESFFIWKPRDIVGGDFIFIDSVKDGFIIAVLDCTGHGVPGAFMTIIACFGLRKIVKGEGRTDPAQILKRLGFLVKTTLQQDTDYALSDDGLDAAVCFVSGSPDSAETNLVFAGAKLPLIHICDGGLTVIKGDKQSLGYKKSSLNFDFTNHAVKIEKGMSFYMFSDGFADQLGGERNRRFGSRRFRELLKENVHLPFEEQREILVRSFEEYRGGNERQDDVTLLGFGFE